MITRESLASDHKMIDLKEQAMLLRKTQPQLDVASGTYTPTSSDEILLDNCLFREASDRTSSVIRQIFQRGVSIANVSIDTVDTVMEFWHGDEVQVNVNDLIRRIVDNVTFEVLAFDSSTGRTRFRCALRKIK